MPDSLGQNEGEDLPVYADHANMKKDWTSGFTEFKYSPDGALLGKFTASGIEKFIRGRDADNKLTLWIQRAPSDDNGRGQADEGLICLCADCPLHRLSRHGIGDAGMIMPQQYMVALDEFESERKQGKSIDPRAVAGHMHLYCVERFLDTSAFGDHAEVKCDYRTFAHEPDGHNPFSLTPDEVTYIQGFIVQVMNPNSMAAFLYPSREAFDGPLGSFIATLTELLHMFFSEDRVDNGDLERLYGYIMTRAELLSEVSSELRHRYKLDLLESILRESHD